LGRPKKDRNWLLGKLDPHSRNRSVSRLLAVSNPQCGEIALTAAIALLGLEAIFRADTKSPTEVGLCTRMLRDILSQKDVRKLAEIDDFSTLSVDFSLFCGLLNWGWSECPLNAHSA
jgi:signal recognition particle subunit SEC65